MRWIGLGWAIGFLFSTTVNADPKEALYRRYLEKESRVESAARSSATPYGEIQLEPKIAPKIFDQVLDHFASSRSRAAGISFKQRYYVDSAFARDENSPVIFYICGESACEGATSTPLVNHLARKYHAHRVALEHRFYGKSQPFGTLTTSHLRYLSMDQAIEDLASFQRFAQTVLNLKGRWISIGGSYPGELSAFYRMKHPELVVGALASSAPVFAKADFFEYDRHVAKVADPACLSVIQSVVTEVEGRLKSEASRKEVKQIFGASEVPHDVDFLYNLADMAAIAIQYGFQEEFCGALISGAKNGKALEAYAKTGQSLFQRLGTSPFLDSFGGAMSLNPEDYMDFAGRQWMYQSCTEFGFYQTANVNSAQSSRSSRIDLSYHNDACNRLFGIQTPVDDSKTNRNFYARLFDSGVKNILFTNGSNDPWSNLSLTDALTTQNVNPGLSLFLISGAAHCDDLGSRITSALSEARSRVDRAFSTWLSE